MCPPRTDVELLVAHRAGDARAFTELVDRHQERLWHVAFRMLHHQEDATDAVQDALVAAFRQAHTYRGDASVRTWLQRILVNVCIDHIRRDRNRRERIRSAQLLAGRATPTRRPDIAAEVTTRLSVEDALAALPDHQRVAVVLVDVQGWHVAEVADVLDVAVGTVKSRCARGRLRLAVLLGHMDEEVAR